MGGLNQKTFRGVDIDIFLEPHNINEEYGHHTHKRDMIDYNSSDSNINNEREYMFVQSGYYSSHNFQFYDSNYSL